MSLSLPDSSAIQLLSRGVVSLVGIVLIVIGFGSSTALASAYALLGIVETGDRLDLDPAEVARVHFALGERLGLPALVERIFALPRDDRWQTMARAALRDDLHSVHAQLTAQTAKA